MKILIREVVTYGTSDDKKHRFSFQDNFGKTKRIADIERASCETMNAIKAENVTQNSLVRGETKKRSGVVLVRAGRTELAGGELTYRVAKVTMVTSGRPGRRR